ncbi:NADP-dependent oxidoreductase [Rothia sp. AR01]|uniref:NADP-dependent oxidoreductase n=1 Tax=Rothia santali TaxID=2949643 RepID=A0A9X2KIM4_9MICC|nr:NADP-dependent oxidoreductase [Rothia santali]MCP3426175.1 NADP-dependent oxidoreductase [Rothia santali]
MTSDVSTQIHLASRPQGWPVEDDFSLVRVELPALREGEVRVRNEFVSVDPYMRGRMSDAPSYIPPFEVGEAMTGGAVGRVVASEDPRLPAGTLVLHDQGWRDLAQGPGEAFRPVPEVEGVPVSLHLGMLGLTGMTAYVGLTQVARLREGDSVFVSGAAGAVGTAVGQIARLLGASRVIGSAGGPEKAALLRERYGYDVALDYRAAPIREQLAEAAGEDGVDVYFDNVGGDHLEAALDVLNRGGRVAVCGAISGYNAGARAAGPDNLTNVIKNSLMLQGFTLGEYAGFAREFQERMGAWLAAGEIAYDETVVEGVENAVAAFLGMMRGENVGKMVVRI